MADWRKAHLAKIRPCVTARYLEHEKTCREKLARGERLKVAFLVCDASMFSGESVYLRMKDDPRFACHIAVVPRVTRGEAFLRETLRKTVDGLKAKYGDVRSLYDPDVKRAEALDADLVFSTVIYEDQTLPIYTTEHLARHSLVALLYYGYGGLFRTNESKTPFLPNIALSWRYFVSNEQTREMSIRKNPMLEDSVVAVGYAKMDRYEEERLKALKMQGKRPKTVVICPHHSIERGTDGLVLSTFLVNADLFLELPKMFPDVRFVFRPHPLLFPRLRTEKWWGERRTADYERAMEAFPNVEFQRGGDYFATFAASDALIHDCGSFLAEYFYTGKPQCYLLESEQLVAEQFLSFGQSMLRHVYRAFVADEVISFIRQVVLAGEDPMWHERYDFAAREVCINHPHVTDVVVDEVMSVLSKGRQ